MSHKNYSKMSTANAVVETDEKIDVDVTPAIIKSDEAEIETVVTPAVVEPEIIEGFVSGCRKLNVRKAPYSRADVVCVIDENANVVIDEVNSTDVFYKVCTEAGAEGYCMKNYITIKQ